MNRRSTRLLLAGAGLTVAAVALLAPSSVPLYDGIGFPDEPYRYVDPPPGSKPTKEPTTAKSASDVKDGTNAGLIFASSAEQGPQFVASIPSHSIRAPSASLVTVTGTPEGPDVEPGGATIDGNVYALAIRPDTGSFSTDSSFSVAYVAMRATTAKQPGPTMYFRTSPSQTWQPLHTVRVGNDIYQSPLPGAGDYVLAFSRSGGSGGGLPVGLIVALVVMVVALGGVLLVVRLRRGGDSEPEPS